MLNKLFISLPQLETERLILRKVLYSDQQDIYEYARNPAVAKHVLWQPHQSEFDTIQFLNLVYEAYNHNKAAPWAIELKESHKVIGTVGFVNWNRVNNEAEIGFALSELYWNRGIVTEAVKKIVSFGFQKMELTKIISRCKEQNIGSFRVLEKCGFSFNGISKNNMFIKGKLEDMRLYSYLAEDFRNTQR